jgi:hypothetical protein
MKSRPDEWDDQRLLELREMALDVLSGTDSPAAKDLAAGVLNLLPYVDRKRNALKTVSRKLRKFQDVVKGSRSFWDLVHNGDLDAEG